jgi:uncharacterized protein YraI
MKRFRFQFVFSLFLTVIVLGPSGLFYKYSNTRSVSPLPVPIQASGYGQAAATETPSAAGASAYITQTYTEAINVRTGPSTVDYPTIGQLPIGATAPALATSPHHEWIEISFPGGPGGVGWIYAANVTLTGSLQVVEPPPTATTLATATIDPTLVAAFHIEPTETRLPTFTPAPPLAIPTYQDPVVPAAGFPMGGAIFVIAVVGVLALVVSVFGRR